MHLRMLSKISNFRGKLMKLGIAGTGMIAQEVLPFLCSMNLEKIYLCGRENSRERTEALCRDYELDGCFVDYDEFLKADFDTVYIALPNNLHFSFAREALLCGKHVILEKPITVTYGELKELNQIAKKKNRFLLEAMSMHHTPAYQSIRENLGRLGKIRIVNFQFCQYSSRYDAFLEGKIAPAFDPACAGGALMDLNIYNLHAIVGLFGKPVSVHYFPNMQKGVDTSGILILNYEEFQAVAVAAKDCQAPVCSTIQGEKGCISIRMPMNQIDCYELSGNRGQSQVMDFHSDAYRLSYEFLEFERIIREKDWKRAEELMQISLDVMEVLEMCSDFGTCQI